MQTRSGKPVAGQDSIFPFVTRFYDVKLMMSMLEGSWIKGKEQDLVCLSSGKLATPELKKDLQVEAFGERA